MSGKAFHYLQNEARGRKDGRLGKPYYNTCGDCVANAMYVCIQENSLSLVLHTEVRRPFHGGAEAGAGLEVW